MNTVTPEQPLLVSKDEAAKRLGICKRTLEREIAAHKFPRPVRVRRRVLIPVSAIEGYLRRITGQVALP